MTSRTRFLAALALPRRALARRALTIGYVPSNLFAPLFVAAERGYLRDAGFDETLQPIIAGADSMALVAQGQIDLAGAALSAAFFNAVSRGLDVAARAFSGVYSAVREGGYDVIHNHAFDAPAVALATALGAPVLHTVHLPPGAWYDYWTGLPVAAGPGSATAAPPPRPAH